MSLSIDAVPDEGSAKAEERPVQMDADGVVPPAAVLSARVSHWLASAQEDDDPGDAPPPTPSGLFNGDTGTLRSETRRCLVALLNGPSVDGRRQGQLWSILTRDREAIQTFLHNIFLDLVVDIPQQVAFIRQVPDEGEADIPILLRRQQLTFIDSALVLYLRQRLTEADSANERAVVSTQEMSEHLAVFEKARNTDLARFDRQIAGAIEKCKTLNLIRPIRASEGRFEVSPTLKLLFSAEDIQALTNTYEGLKSAPPPAAELTLDEAIARGVAGADALDDDEAIDDREE
ncbi:DUF4194 domain-containing protein [Roseateles noduli]|uniref:DUF4194 domain-containing protein n=1 Tax=Roseateles noduli TaxID=2052484 RepID=UPI003D64D36C